MNGILLTGAFRTEYRKLEVFSFKEAAAECKDKLGGSFDFYAVKKFFNCSTSICDHVAGDGSSLSFFT